MVDIDGEVVDLCKKHLPEMHQGAFEDARTELRHEDARAYLEKTSERFDFIRSTWSSPWKKGPACLLFTKEFYTLVRDRLTPGGAMTMQAGMTKVGELDFFSAIHRTLQRRLPGGGRLPDVHLLLRHAVGVHHGHQEGRSHASRTSPPSIGSSPTASRARWPTGTATRTSTPSTCPSTSGRPSTRRRAS